MPDVQSARDQSCVKVVGSPRVMHFKEAVDLEVGPCPLWLVVSQYESSTKRYGFVLETLP